MHDDGMTHLTSVSGTPIGRFSYGTMQWGGKANLLESKEMFDASRASGIVHFDTAYLYTDGNSETILGNLARDCRDELFVATKVAYAKPATRDVITSQFDTSRARLQMDMVDLLYLHKFDPTTPLEQTFDVLADLKQQGLIRHIGVSNFSAWQVMKAQAIANEREIRIDVIQPMYNLVKRQVEVELLPMCASEDILPVTYSPLGGGLLSGKYSADTAQGRLTEDTRYAARYAQSQMHETAKALVALAADIGVHPATLAVAWAARHPSGVVPILSARSLDQLRPSLDAMQFTMGDALYDQLTALGPTPPPATDRIDEI